MSSLHHYCYIYYWSSIYYTSFIILAKSSPASQVSEAVHLDRKKGRKREEKSIQLHPDFKSKITFVEKLFFSIKTSNMKYKEAYKHALLTNKVLNYPKDVNLKSSG